MLIGVVAISGWKVIESDLKGRGKPLLSTYLNLTCAAIAIPLNVVLIPGYGVPGAAWASTISYVIAFIAALVFYIVISGNKIADLIIIKKSDLVYYSNILKSFALNK
jgi:Na+-driven multidrug efflux pump